MNDRNDAGPDEDQPSQVDRDGFGWLKKCMKWQNRSLFPPYLVMCGDGVRPTCLTVFLQPASVSLHLGGGLSFLLSLVFFSAAHLPIISRFCLTLSGCLSACLTGLPFCPCAHCSERHHGIWNSRTQCVSKCQLSPLVINPPLCYTVCLFLVFLLKSTTNQLFFF